MNNYIESAAYIKAQTSLLPKIAVVLGSGLGVLAEKLTDSVKIPYTTIPHFPPVTNASHSGIMHIGNLAGKPVLMMAGRYHYYEGYSMEEVVYPIGVMKQLGVEKVLLTNAAGGLNYDFQVGDLMTITDYIKFFNESPTRGLPDTLENPRFFDMSHAYDKDITQEIQSAACKFGYSMKEGTYAFMPGPQFETPAEIRMLRTLGASAVGMSTVPETIMANYLKMKVAAVSCITNMAAGMINAPITDAEVVETANRVSDLFINILSETVKRI